MHITRLGSLVSRKVMVLSGVYLPLSFVHHDDGSRDRQMEHSVVPSNTNEARGLRIFRKDDKGSGYHAFRIHSILILVNIVIAEEYF